MALPSNRARLPVPTTKSQALSTSYLSDWFEFHSAKSITFILDDAAIGFTVKVRHEGGDDLEYVIAAGGDLELVGDRGQLVLVNVKSASGTPNALIKAA